MRGATRVTDAETENDPEGIMAEKSKTQQIAEWLLADPVHAEQTNKLIAERFGVDPGNVSRARKLAAEIRAGGGPKGKVVTLALADLVLDPKVQQRPGLDKAAVARYQDAYESGEELPPLVAFGPPERPILAGGWHRHAALQQAGIQQAKVEVREGTLADAVKYAAGDNARHGLPRDDKTITRSIRSLLEVLKEEAKAKGEKFKAPSVEQVRTAVVCSWEKAKSVLEGFDTVAEYRAAKNEKKADRKVKDVPPVQSAGQSDRINDGSADEVEDAFADSDLGELPDDEPEADDESEFLLSLPIRARVQEPTFNAAALRYKAAQPVLLEVRKLANQLRADGAKKGDDDFTDLVLGLADALHPRDWKVCLNCNGTGRVGKTRCNCKGGFRVV